LGQPGEVTPQEAPRPLTVQLRHPCFGASWKVPGFAGVLALSTSVSCRTFRIVILGGARAYPSADGTHEKPTHPVPLQPQHRHKPRKSSLSARSRAQQKARIAAESLAPGVVISEVARRHDLRPQQLFTWRRPSQAGTPRAAGGGAVVRAGGMARPMPRPSACGSRPPGPDRNTLLRGSHTQGGYPLGRAPNDLARSTRAVVGR
jgi:Transposase